MIRFRNKSADELKFSIGGSNYVAPPKGEVHIDDKHAPFVRTRGLPLDPVDPIPSESARSLGEGLPSMAEIRDELQRFGASIRDQIAAAGGDIRERFEALQRTVDSFDGRLKKVESAAEKLIALEKRVAAIETPKGKAPTGAGAGASAPNG